MDHWNTLPGLLALSYSGLMFASAVIALACGARAPKPVLIESEKRS